MDFVAILCTFGFRVFSGNGGTTHWDSKTGDGGGVLSYEGKGEGERGICADFSGVQPETGN
jgi:hypothetical protein